MSQTEKPQTGFMTTRASVPRKIIFSLFTMGCGLLLILSVMEAALRLLRPDIAPRGTSAGLVIDSLYDGSPGLRANSHGVTGNVGVEVDALGFWKYSAPTDTSAEGWLLLGDSVTMGIGIESDSTFAGRLAAASPQYRVMNASWIGYTCADYLNAARAIFRKFNEAGISHPKVGRVTVFWTLNDIYADCSIGLPPGQAVRETGGSLLPWLRRNYITYQWFKNIIFDRSKDYYAFDEQFYREGDERLRISAAKLDSLNRLCASHSVRLNVVLLPYEYQLRTRNAASFLPQRLMASMLDSLKIPWQDASISPEFSSAPAENYYLFGDGIHFSHAGHRAMFRFLSASASSR